MTRTRRRQPDAKLEATDAEAERVLKLVRELREVIAEVRHEYARRIETPELEGERDG